MAQIPSMKGEVRVITIRPGSRVGRLLFLLSIAGEFPVNALHLIGNGRDYIKLIRRLEQVQEFRFDRGGKVYTTKLITISGKRNARTIRLYKGALPILNEFHPDSLGYYLDSFRNHRFSGDEYHISRNFRVSEALAMSMMAGIEIRPYILPKLQKTKIDHVIPRFPSFYIARDLKKLDPAGHNKTMFTRVIGALFYPGGVYAVYNTRDAVMRWSGMGEFKTVHHLLELARMNAGIDEVRSAMLLGATPDTALETLIQSDKSRRLELRFDKIYHHIHFIPMDTNGIRLMKILTLPDWNERMLRALFSENARPRGYGFMEYDALWDDVYIYSHLDSDIARLVRFRQGIDTQTEPKKFEVLCFPWQARFLSAYLGQRVKLKLIEMEAIECALS